MADTYINSYDLPNFVGDLFLKGKRPNTTLQLIGGINGWQPVYSTQFPVGQSYAIADHASQPAVLEGADAPDATGIVRAQVFNVVQIFQEKVRVTYTAEAARQLLTGVNNGQSNPVTSELDFQTAAVMEKLARQINYVIINGAYQLPTDNTTGRKTRGLLAATTTNAVAAGTAALTEAHLESALEKLVTSGGIADGENVICLSNTFQLRQINALYKTAFNQGQDRTIGGVRVRTVYTAFGTINFALEPDMPQGSLLFVNFDEIALKALPVPGKGVLFREELSKTGASTNYQIYGELGLDHGIEIVHAKITGLTTS